MAGMWLGSGWKMTMLRAETDAFCRELDAYVRQHQPPIELFIVPAYPYIGQARSILDSSPVRVGAQNMHWEDAGAYTGEVSPRMLIDVGASIVELGHHERRTLFGETDAMINRKMKAAFKHGLRPLLCVGEAVRMEEAEAVAIVQGQLRGALEGVGVDVLHELLLAYEPGWAIGTGGEAADASYVTGMHAALRQLLSDLASPETADAVPILYGGSVDQHNAERYLRAQGVDGLFVGRAARRAADFIALIEMAARLCQDDG